MHKNGPNEMRQEDETLFGEWEMRVWVTVSTICRCGKEYYPAWVIACWKEYYQIIAYVQRLKQVLKIRKQEMNVRECVCRKICR